MNNKLINKLHRKSVVKTNTSGSSNSIYISKQIFHKCHCSVLLQQNPLFRTYLGLIQTRLK